MNDIFLSYARNDADFARILVPILRRQEWSVFVDYDSLSPLDKFRDKIKVELINSKLVIALWTTNSLTSNWVIEEAEIGAKQNKLLQVLLEEVEIPLGLGLRQFQYFDMTKWDRSYTHRLVFGLLDEVSKAINRPATGRKQLEALALVEHLDFTQKWMLALRTDRIETAFVNFITTRLREISSDWDPLIFISYAWLLDEIVYSGKFSAELWDVLTAIVEDSTINDGIRQYTLHLLPLIHKRLACYIDLSLPELFDKGSIQLIYSILINYLSGGANPSDNISPVISRPQGLLTWLWDQYDDEPRTHMFLMIVQYLRDRKLLSDTINEQLLDESAYATPETFGNLLERIKTDLDNPR